MLVTKCMEPIHNNKTYYLPLMILLIFNYIKLKLLFTDSQTSSNIIQESYIVVKATHIFILIGDENIS